MKITTLGRKVNLKDTFTERVEKRLAKLDKFFTDQAQAQVTVSVEKSWQTVEITVRDKGLMVRAEKAADRMEDAFDDAADVLTQRVIRCRKRMDKQATQAAEVPIPEPEAEEEEHSIIREKRFSVKPCSAEEAVLQMEMLGHSFFMFRDAETDEINVVYRRNDGNYGLLIPER